jgi:hypothetical protein
VEGETMRGKKTDIETIYKVMLSYITTGNYSETGRELDLPESTVRKIVADNREEPEFARLCEQKREEFVERADRIIYKAMDRLESSLNNDEEHIPVNNLSTVIGTIYDKRALAKGEPTSNERLSIKVELTD